MYSCYDVVAQLTFDLQSISPLLATVYLNAPFRILWFTCPFQFGLQKRTTDLWVFLGNDREDLQLTSIVGYQWQATAPTYFPFRVTTTNQELDVDGVPIFLVTGIYHSPQALANQINVQLARVLNPFEYVVDFMNQSSPTGATGRVIAYCSVLTLTNHTFAGSLWSALNMSTSASAVNLLRPPNTMTYQSYVTLQSVHTLDSYDVSDTLPFAGSVFAAQLQSSNYLACLVNITEQQGDAIVRIPNPYTTRPSDMEIIYPGTVYPCCNTAYPLAVVPLSLYRGMDAVDETYDEFPKVRVLKTSNAVVYQSAEIADSAIDWSGSYVYMHACTGAWTSLRYNIFSGLIQFHPKNSPVIPINITQDVATSLYISPNRSVPRPTPDAALISDPLSTIKATVGSISRTVASSGDLSVQASDAFALYGSLPVSDTYNLSALGRPTWSVLQSEIMTELTETNLNALGDMPINIGKELNAATYPSPYVTAFRAAMLSFVTDTSRALNYSGSTVSSTQMVCYNARVASMTLPNQELDLPSGGLTSAYPYLFLELANDTAASAHNRNILYSNNPNAVFATFTCPISDVNAPTTTKFIKIFSAGSQSFKFNPNDNLRVRLFMPDGQPFRTVRNDYLPPVGPNPLLQISILFEISRS